MILHLPTPRLLPITIVVLGAVLVVKTIDLAHQVAASFTGSQPGGVVAAAHAAVPDKPQAAAPVPVAPATPSPQAAAPDAAGSPPVSDGERAVLLDLRQRRQELDARDAALSVRESILAAAEQKLTSRVEELAALQKKLQDLEAVRQQREDASWQGLVKLYEDMKPRDAATIFNDLQMPVLLALVDRMKALKAAPILAAMNPDKAREVTAGLAKMRTRGNAPGDAPGNATGASARNGG
jgi:flagellar motility protein MotE (MotC chaperone)